MGLKSREIFILINIQETFPRILMDQSMNSLLNLLIMMSMHSIMHTLAMCLLKNIAKKQQLFWLAKRDHLYLFFGSRINMDLWNNRIGRKLGLKTKNRIKVGELFNKPLDSGELIICLDDSRKFTETVPPKP